MSQDWYLMTSDHDTVSGFESDNFKDFAQDAFTEATYSAIGETVEICNFDLTERKQARVIIQGNVQDTRLNALQRKLFAPIGTCRAGQYVFYKNRYWLIIGLVDDNKVYEKAVMIICNYFLTWKNRNGDIIQRWVSISSGSQYNNGETSDRFVIMRTDQLIVLTPDDDECILIPHNQRFIIDNRTKVYEKSFEEDVTVDTSKDVLTYRLTRNDNVLFSYQDSGHSQFMAYQDEQHELDGYYVIDGNGYWLCDTPEEDKIPVLSSAIECADPILYNGFEPCIFTAKFHDVNGNEIEVSPQWEVYCDFVDSLKIEYVENSILISADNNKLINKSFELSLYADGYEKVTITVPIRMFI